MNEPLLNMLGIARRAGKLSIGFEAAAEAVRYGKSRLIVAAADVSAKTEKEIRYLIGRRGAEGKQPDGKPPDGFLGIIRIPFDMKTMSKAIGTKAGILSVDDDGLAGAVCKRCPVTGEDDAE